MQFARGYSGSAVIQRSIYVIGGNNADRLLRTNEIFRPDLESESWVEGEPLPSGRSSMGVTGITDIILVVGGLEQAEDSGTILEYL